MCIMTTFVHFTITYMSPGLIMTNGLPCSGKTFLAGQVRPRDMAYRSTDIIRIERGCSDLFNPQHREQAYRHLFDETESLLTHGEDVLVDATFSTVAKREEIYRICRKTRVSLIILSTFCEERILRARMDVRLRSQDTLPEFRFDTLELVRSENELIAPCELDDVNNVALFKIDTGLESLDETVLRGHPKFADHIRHVLSSPQERS